MNPQYALAEQISPDKPLTERQKAFAKYWAAGENPTSAAVHAGFSENGANSVAYKMVRQPNVLRAYEREKRLYEEACQMTRKKVMDMLVESYDMAKLMAEPASMVSAAREIGMMCGYYEPVQKKIDITVNGKQLAKRLDSMSDEELAGMIAQGVAAIEQLDHDEEDEDGAPE